MDSESISPQNSTSETSPLESPAQTNELNEIDVIGEKDQPVVETVEEKPKVQRRASIHDKFRNLTASTTKCPVCQKSVFSAEAVLAVEKSWHKACFKCGGGSSEHGCSKILKDYQQYGGVPYCKPCYSKLFQTMTAAVKSSGETLLTSIAVTNTPKKTELSGRIDASSIKVNEDTGETTLASMSPTKAKSMNAGKCSVCNRTVIKLEEIVVESRVMHKACFICGGKETASSQGCRAMLTEGEYRVHEGVEYCNSCMLRLGKERTGPSQAAQQLSRRKSLITTHQPQSMVSSSSSASSSSTTSAYSHTPHGPILTADQISQSIVSESLPTASKSITSLRHQIADLSLDSSPPPPMPSPSSHSSYATSSASTPPSPPPADSTLTHTTQEASPSLSSSDPEGQTEQGPSEDRVETTSPSPFLSQFSDDSSPSPIPEPINLNSPETNQQPEPEPVPVTIQSSEETLTTSTSEENQPASFDPSPATPEPSTPPPSHETDNTPLPSPQDQPAIEPSSQSQQQNEEDNKVQEEQIGESEEDQEQQVEDVQEVDQQQQTLTPPPPPVQVSSPLPPEPESPSPPPSTGSTIRQHICNFDFAFDQNGVLHLIGTNYGTQPWSNPHTSGRVLAEMSSVYKGGPENLTAHMAFRPPNYTRNAAGSWVGVDLLGDKRLMPDHYVIRHGGSAAGNSMRTWSLQVKPSRDFQQWITLKTHVNDLSLKDNPGSVASFKISISPEDKEKFGYGFQILRLVQQGPNSGRNDCLFCGSVEFYGTLTRVVD